MEEQYHVMHIVYVGDWGSSVLMIRWYAQGRVDGQECSNPHEGYVSWG